jgi:hypothetical protein
MGPTEITALAGAAATVLTAGGLLINDRRKGRASTHEYQRIYIQDQQDDIKALRRDLSQLWDWAVRAIRKAGAAGVQLDPLPAEPPESKHAAEIRSDRPG